MQYQWPEDDSDVPCGVGRLGLHPPVSGERYIMYHGTSSSAAQSILATGFRPSPKGLLGRGVYLSRDPEKAHCYPMNHPKSDRVVIKVVVNVGKVIAIDCRGHPRQRTWHDSRCGEVYDTAWVPRGCGMVRSPLEVICVWDPNRIQIISTMDFDVPCGVRRLGLDAPVSGERYIMYHGISSSAAQSILLTGLRWTPKGLLGRGVYLSRDLEKARRYPVRLPECYRVVVKVVVDVGKVIAIDCRGHPRQRTWHDYRYGEVYDTAWVPRGCGMVRSPLEVICVWDPNRIQIISTIKPRPL